MTDRKNKFVAVIVSFWFLSLMAIFISLAVAITLYRSKFGGILSPNSTDWSNFGSYVGGVFGPLVSFVTLLAVLKTVYMQRELLDNQAEEFVRMNTLQQQTFDASLHQMTGAAADARKLQVSAAQDTAIKVIDQHLSIIDRALSSNNELTYKLVDRHDVPKTPASQKLLNEMFEKALIDKKSALVKIQKLADLSTLIGVSDYRTTDQVRKVLLTHLDEILKKPETDEFEKS